jgi:hypothetical protein
MFKTIAKFFFLAFIVTAISVLCLQSLKCEEAAKRIICNPPNHGICEAYPDQQYRGKDQASDIKLNQFLQEAKKIPGVTELMKKYGIEAPEIKSGITSSQLSLGLGGTDMPKCCGTNVPQQTEQRSLSIQMENGTNYWLCPNATCTGQNINLYMTNERFPGAVMMIDENGLGFWSKPPKSGKGK